MRTVTLWGEWCYSHFQMKWSRHRKLNNLSRVSQLESGIWTWGNLAPELNPLCCILLSLYLSVWFSRFNFGLTSDLLFLTFVEFLVSLLTLLFLFLKDILDLFVLLSSVYSEITQARYDLCRVLCPTLLEWYLKIILEETIWG